MLCSLIQIGFHYYEDKYLEDQFDYFDDKTIPLTLNSTILYSLYIVFLLIPVMVNYLVFYFYVKKSYTKLEIRKSRFLSEDDIIRYQDVKPGKGIKSFLS